MTSTQAVARVRLSNVYPYVREFRDFDCNGTLRGTHKVHQSFGQMPQEYGRQYLDAQGAVDFYAVYSYDTPIAWFSNGAWFVPPVKYSPTTSRHLSAIRKGIA